ncbi:DNA adenine methylase [Methanoculleus sp. 7T]|uniref:DNA adenine methylase n=1 Tax=Methanoculleus sp. 7T TaxID=2937282 RepID=UPI0020C11327|nr:DNA adenine methylase [Methanoculleus sp. 7T]MCK8518293.1 DNA adenine methylase [Methanoculleus sp. 7T]
MSERQNIQTRLDSISQRSSSSESKDRSKHYDNERQDKDGSTIPRPFVKWAGGKRCLLNDLIANLPETFEEYYEPFVGGGALFFALHNRIKKAYLSDINLDLMLVYSAIKKDPYQLLEALKIHANSHSKDYYYSIRSEHELKDPIDIAARFLYLNRTCYNGLYRVNKAGQFNVPIGDYKNPNIVQEANILACHEALKKAEIKYNEFDHIYPKKNDFVYFDPPYHPTDDASFTSYTKQNFTETDQVRLKDFALNLHKKGVKVMLSNSNTKFIRDIYKNKAFTLLIVNAPRYVNCKSEGRSAVEEVLIRSY